MALARQIVVDALPVAERNGIEVSLVSPDTLPLHLPVETVHSVLDNLVRNALQHCPRGTNVEILLGEEGDGTVRMVVRDDGPGIPPDEEGRLRQRFQRGRRAQAPGAGLGLAIAGEAARRLGCTLVLGPGLQGRGLNVSLLFPAPAAQRPSPPQAGPG